MKTRTPATKYFLATAAAGCIAIGALTGCFDPASPSSGEGDGNMNATLEGRVQGDMALAKRASGSAGIEGATVTVMRIKSDGSLEAVAGAGVEVKTDVQGRFSIRTAVDGVRELVVVAKKDAKEWKGVVSAKVGQGSHIVCRPLNTESSVEADVLIRTRGQAKSVTVSFADIASHIDAEMAVKADAKADVEGYLAAQLQTEAETRASVLIASSGKFTLAQLDKADEARMDAEAKYEADLDAAIQSSASAEAQVKAGADFEQAEFKAFADAGIALGEVAKAREASFQAMVESGAKLTIGTDAAAEADAKKTWLHKIAIGEAATLEAAVNADVKASGGRSDISTEAGAALKASLNAAKDKAECDSAFARFRATVSTGLKSLVETTLGAKVLLSDSSQARLELKASLALATASGSPEKVAEAYKKFYVDAETEIKGNITATLGAAASDSAKVRALTRAVLLVGIQGDGGKSGGIQIGGNGGFSLSGRVEGGLSGADVQVAKVKADGSLEIISGFSGKTDAQGGFTINSETRIPDSIVVVITKNDSKLLTFVDSTTSKPLRVGSETTVETQVYQQTVKDGKTAITLEQIKAQVDSNVAASVKGNDSAMVHLIASLETSYRTQDRFLMDSGFALSASGLAAIATARASAETKLEADIKAAAGIEASIRTAYDTYQKTLVDASVKAGLDASAYARSQQVYAQALAHFSVDLAAQAKIGLVRGAHAGAARGLRAAAEAQIKASGASEAAIKSMTDAGLVLQASVEAAVSVEAISAAYETYHAAAAASLKTAFILQAGAIETLDTKIHGQGGARAELLAKVKSGIDADAVAKAHVDFAAAVETQVKAAFGGGLGAPSGAQIKTMTEVMVLANMGG